MVLVNLGFHTRKNLFEHFPQFERASSKIFASPVLGRKRLRNAKLLAFPGRPNQWLLYVLERFYNQKFYILLTENLYMFGMDRRTIWATYCNLIFWRVRVTIVEIEVQQCILHVCF